MYTDDVLRIIIRGGELYEGERSVCRHTQTDLL